MNVLFVGLMYNPVDEDSLIATSKSGIGIASNLLQWNFIKALTLKYEFNVSVLFSLAVGNFPKNNNKIIYNGKKHINHKLINYLET